MKYVSYQGKRRATSAKNALKVLIALILAGILTFGTLLGLVLSGARDQISGEPQIMIILGCKVMPGGYPSVLLEDRLDEALKYLENHPDMTVVVSGGQGPDEPCSEADAMADYLIDHGIPEENILREGNSHNTNENLRHTAELLAEYHIDTTEDMIVVSNGFHLARIRMLWQRVWGSDQNLSTLAAPASHQPSRLYMYFREPIALLKSFILDRR